MTVLVVTVVVVVGNCSLNPAPEDDRRPIPVPMDDGTPSAVPVTKDDDTLSPDPEDGVIFEAVGKGIEKLSVGCCFTCELLVLVVD